MGLISAGTTLLDAGALDSGVATGAMTLIKTITSSNVSDISFVHGTSNVVFDSTYKEYCFKIINMNPATDNHIFQVGFRDGGSNYDAVKTSSAHRAIVHENGTSAALAYVPNDDLDQSTDYQRLANGVGNAADESLCGVLCISEPSSTTFVKHFWARCQFNEAAAAQGTTDHYVGGYCNTTTAIDGVQFKMASGNFDATIKLYGIK